MEVNALHIIPHPGFPNRAKLFYENYDLKSIFGPGVDKFSKKSLKKYKDRVCLFCGKGFPEVTFATEAHLLPQLIGNSSMYSDFECDNCNARFSLFEDSLANFIGVSRSIAGLNEAKKAKGFDSKKLVAKSRSFVGDNILIIAPEDIVKDPLIEGKSTFSYEKNKFLPSHVYKALLKGALSLLGAEQALGDYPLALKYLNGDIILRSGALIGGYKLGFNLNLPLHVYVFEKRSTAVQIPPHVMVFHFQNNIIALPLPFYAVDIKSNNQPFTIFLPPPYFTNVGNLEMANPVAFERDLYSDERIENEVEVITLQMDMSSPESIGAYDPVTDQTNERKYNPEGIKYLVMTRDGVVVDPKAFSAFIKEEMEKEN